MKKKSVNLVTAVGVLVILSGAYVGVKTYVAKQDAKEEESNEEDNQEVVSIASEDIQSCLLYTSFIIVKLWFYVLELI